MVVGNVLPMHPVWWFLFTWEPKYSTGFLIKKSQTLSFADFGDISDIPNMF
jgi:hypothetical protein